MNLHKFYTFQNYFFDLDGTLTDSEKDVKESIRRALADYDLPFNEKKLLIGPMIDKIIDVLVPDIESQMKENLIRSFRRHYNEGAYSQTVLYPGVKELLNKLTEMGKSVYLATNKPMASTLGVLGKMGIRENFNFIGTPDCVEGKMMTKKEVLAYIMHKYHLNAQKSLMIGDTVGDMEAGEFVSAKNCAVTFGYGEKGFEKQSSVEIILNSYLNLLNKKNLL